MTASKHYIKTGITAIPFVNQGTHICHFFKDKQELFDVIVPYVKTGLINNETELERRDMMGQIHGEVYKRLKVTYQTERIYINECKAAITSELAQLSREKEAQESLLQIKLKFHDRLCKLNHAEWRDLFTILNLKVNVGDDVDIDIGVPLYKAQQVNDIVFTRA